MFGAIESWGNYGNPYPSQQKTMQVFKVAITQKPSPNELQSGKTEEFVLPSVEVIADSKEHAVAIAVHQSRELLTADIDHPPGRWTVLVKSEF